jgi:hypothetical protein
MLYLDDMLVMDPNILRDSILVPLPLTLRLPHTDRNPDHDMCLIVSRIVLWFVHLVSWSLSNVKTNFKTLDRQNEVQLRTRCGRVQSQTLEHLASAQRPNKALKMPPGLM